jgi:ATP-binding cassette subfamily F protein uup
MADTTIWLDRGNTKIMRKNFGHFENWRDKELAREEEEMHKLDRKISREEDWVRYGVTARRKRNVRRMADLMRLRQQKRDHRGPEGGIDASIVAGERSGKLVVKADKLHKSYGEKTVVRNFSTQVKRGARIGLVGANGAGKTTLLKMLLGELEPDQGQIRLGKNLTPLVLDQKRSGIKKNWTIKDALTDGAGDQVPLGEETMHVIGYMRNFLFHPSQMRTPANILSGGEQARLLLARGLRQPSNLLVMDEPTNDLDLETLDLLQEMIASYEGTVLLVSHDRDFLDRTVTTVFHSDGDGVWMEYAGGYSDMKAQQKSQIESDKALAETRKIKSSSGSSKPAAGEPQVAKPAAKKAGKMSYKHKFRLEKLPDEMSALTARIRARATLANAEEEWLELEVLREQIEASA